MAGATALLTFGIGPVHTFIIQARRLADLWAGSYLLSDLVRQAIAVVRDTPGCAMVFPYLEGIRIPEGLPNRFVCRVPQNRADEIARAMGHEVERVWDVMVKSAVRRLEEHGLGPAPGLWIREARPGTQRQTDGLLEIAWSWVPEAAGADGYAKAAILGARRYTAVRRFRPFRQTAELGEKCAICGERTALPDGDRDHVRKAWKAAEERTLAEEGPSLAPFFRFDQGRLCLVCATKRLFAAEERRRARFLALDAFQPSENAPYFALVKVDGDRMGSTLSLGPDAVADRDLEGFHREVSKALSEFAGGLQKEHSPELNLQEIGGYEPRGKHPPHLLYAGGDDVLFVCDPRDALPVVARIRERYHQAFEQARSLLSNPADRERFTASAAVLFAHSGHPAGLLLRDVEKLLKEKAKDGAGRNAVAIRLDKRGGTPVDVAFPWNDQKAPEKGWIGALNEIAGLLREGSLSSGQSFSLRLEEKTLQEVFGENTERWTPWLQDRLTRNEATSGEAKTLAAQVVPFFLHGRANALRIARFLGKEAER